MITSTARIIREVQELLVKIRLIGNCEEEVLDIGLRFANKTVHKVYTKVSTLLQDVWLLLDNKHELFKEFDYKGRVLNSIWIQEKTGTVIYDSLQYRSGPDKFKLKKEPNDRVKKFKNLSQQDKDRTVGITIEQINSYTIEDLKKDRPKDDEDWNKLNPSLPWDQ